MELKLLNKRLIFVLFIVCLFSKANSQIKLYDELKKISQTENNIKVKNRKEYVKLGEKGIVPINLTKKELKLYALFFSSIDDDLFFYVILTDNEIFSNKKNIIFYSNTILMFDKKNDKIFFLEYGFEGACVLKLDKKNFKVMNDFEKNISRIVVANKDYIPEISLSIEFINEYSLFCIKKYFMNETKWYREKSLFTVPIIEFENLTYLNFIQLMSESKLDNSTTEECTLDDNFMFFKFK